MTSDLLMPTGLCSVTFRKLDPPTILDLAARAGLDGIDWGGDVHVPAGDVAAARRVATLTQDAGLKVVSYGSYYRLGTGGDFTPVLDAAEAMGAPVIRVWAGPSPETRIPDSAAADWRTRVPDERHADLWASVADDASACCHAAGRRGVVVAFEHHHNTFTATAEGANRLYALLDPDAASHAAGFWQPNQWLDSDDDRQADLTRLAIPLAHVHVFNWVRDGQAVVRRPLDESTRWPAWLAEAARRPTPAGLARHAVLEFLPDDDPSRLAGEVQTLRRWLTPAG